jgi:tryptophan synthase alpha chain
MNGLEHISQTFARVRAEGRAALMPYFTLGYPTPEDSLAILQAIAGAGADLIELGIPFSDPLADGPTIQHSTQVALERGMTLGRALEITAELRSCHVSQPLLLMGYYNPILAYGVERFVRQAVSAGVDGFIIPDLPPEEAADLEAACRLRQCALVYLLAPTSTPERTATITAHTSGFLYLVSVVGVTGRRESLATDLEPFLNRARRAANVPVAVGFGISTPDQAQTVGRLADGVIVGSALIEAVSGSARPTEAAARFVRSLRRALEPETARLKSRNHIQHTEVDTAQE